MHGGKMDAADISEIISKHRNIGIQSAGAQRSIGLKILSTLGYVEIDREGNRLREVRLVKGKAATGGRQPAKAKKAKKAKKVKRRN